MRDESREARMRPGASNEPVKHGFSSALKRDPYLPVDMRRALSIYGICGILSSQFVIAPNSSYTEYSEHPTPRPSSLFGVLVYAPCVVLHEMVHLTIPSGRRTFVQTGQPMWLASEPSLSDRVIVPSM